MEIIIIITLMIILVGMLLLSISWLIRTSIRDKKHREEFDKHMRKLIDNL